MIEAENPSEYKHYDIAIIGAGPAGIMAAISAASTSASLTGKGSLSICILERNESAARKLLLTGNGRCNYTTDTDMDGMLAAFGKKGRFFSEALNEFSNRDLITFFEAEGIEPDYEKSDEDGILIKVFPKNKNAVSIRDCLVEKLQEKNIDIFYGFRAEKILKVENPAETSKNYLFEIMPYCACGFDKHLNYSMNKGPEKNAIGTGDVLYCNQKANISVTDKSSIDNHLSENSSIDGYKLSKEPFSLSARKVILATGGMTYPHTGSMGDGYIIAKNLGHSVNDLIPYLVPVFSKDRDINLLTGITVKDVGLKILSGKRIIAKSTGSILFTHRGLSGPCAVSIGHEVYKLLKNKYKKDLMGNDGKLFSVPGSKRYKDKTPAEDHTGIDHNLKRNSGQELLRNYGKNLIQDNESDNNGDFLLASLDLAPDLSFEDFRKEISRVYTANPKKELFTILNIILKNVPQRLLDLVLIRCKITRNIKIGNLSKNKLTEIYDFIKSLEFKIDSTPHFEEAIVTDGGIPIKEINPRDLQSVLINGLYFAGEIIELAGPEGGFNLQKAFSTGWLAGKSAAKSLS